MALGDAAESYLATSNTDVSYYIDPMYPKVSLLVYLFRSGMPYRCRIECLDTNSFFHHFSLASLAGHPFALSLSIT
jgi:hypothetical protein